MQRGLRQKLLETYPGFEPYIEEIMPKKASLEAVKLYVSQQTLTTPPLLFPSHIQIKTQLTQPQPRTYNPVHNRLNTSVLPTL